MSNKFMWLGLYFMLIFFFSCAPKTLPIASETKPSVNSPATAIEKSGWESQWKKILKEAKKGGMVSFYGPPIAETRIAFIDGFQKAYPGITLL